MSGSTWQYQPSTHKTKHQGRQRTICIGPRAQQVLRSFLLRNIRGFLFSPVCSEKERRLAQHEARKTPLGCGNRPGKNRKASRRRNLGEHYKTASYGRAIKYACDRAFTPSEKVKSDPARLNAWRKTHRWSPNQLRHNFATSVRQSHGLEAAQVLLGHARADVTQIYAEVNHAKAIEVAAKIG